MLGKQNLPFWEGVEYWLNGLSEMVSSETLWACTAAQTCKRDLVKCTKAQKKNYMMVRQVEEH
jgi:hypothetical protein